MIFENVILFVVGCDLCEKKDIEKNTLLISYKNIQFIINLKEDLPYYFPKYDYTGKKVSFFTRLRLNNLFQLWSEPINLKDGFTFVFPYEMKDSLKLTRYDDPENDGIKNSSNIIIFIFLIIFLLFIFIISNSNYIIADIQNQVFQKNIPMIVAILLYLIFLFYFFRKNGSSQNNQPSSYICKMYLYGKRMYKGEEYTHYYVRVYDKEKFVLCSEIMVSEDFWNEHKEDDEVILDISIRNEIDVFVDIDEDKTL